MTVIVAMSLDGKIADYQRHAARFGSEADKSHLERQISLVDAVIFGAETLRAYHTSLPITDPTLLSDRLSQSLPPQPIHIVCSASGNLNPQWRFFQQPIPRWLLTTREGQKGWNNISTAFEKIISFNHQNEGFNWPEILGYLGTLNLHHIAVLGGGTLIGSLLSAGVIDEWYITLCPLILGGKTAPSFVEGIQFLEKEAPFLDLIDTKIVNNEVFLHYQKNKK